MTRYGVLSPSFTSFNVYDGTYGCSVQDYEEVEAETPAKAKAAAVRIMRRQRDSWVADNLSDGHSPFKGLQVFRLCEHGARLSEHRRGECDG